MLAIDGDRLRRARTAAGLSRGELALAVGVAVSRISEWERGLFVHVPSVIPMLAHALRVGTGTLLQSDPAQGGPSLAQLRHSSGLSEVSLAALAGISVVHYRQLERGWLAAPEEDQLLVEGVADALDLPSDVIAAIVVSDRERRLTPSLPEAAER